MNGASIGTVLFRVQAPSSIVGAIDRCAGGVQRRRDFVVSHKENFLPAYDSQATVVTPYTALCERCQGHEGSLQTFKFSNRCALESADDLLIVPTPVF